MNVVGSLTDASVRASISARPELFVDGDRLGVVRWKNHLREVIDLFPVSSDKIPDITEFAILDETQ